MEKTHFWNKNMTLLFISGGMRSFMIMMPILTLFFQDKGLSMMEVMILQVIFAVVIVFLEIPSGYFADLIKRKYSLNIGFLLAAIGFSVYIFAKGFWGFCVAEILLGISASFISGADEAYLYDELKSKQKENLYQKADGQYASIKNFSEAGAAFISGFLASISFDLVLYVQAGVMFLGFFLSLFLEEDHSFQKEKSKLSLKNVGKVLITRGSQIKYFILFSALLSTSTLVFVWLCQPFWKELGLPLTYFGIVWGILNLLVGVSSLFAYKIEKFFTFKQIFFLFWVLSFILYFLLSVTTNLYLALIISSGFWIFRGINGSIIKDYINKEVSSHIRATVMSIKNLFSRAVFSVLSPFIGYIADVYTLKTSLFLSSIIFFSIVGISFFLMLFSRKRHKIF